MRLIDVDAMNEELFYEEIGGKDTLITCETVFEMIKAQPIVFNCNEVIDKLAEYENFEEQVLLLRLPCKVGDVVWDNDFGKPCTYTITGFSFGTCEGYIDEPVSEKEVVYYYSNSIGSITGSFAVSELGKTVFLTQEEAEQKLKEMESDNSV